MKAEKGSLSWPQQRSVERGGKPCEWEVTDGATMRGKVEGRF